MLSSLMRRRSFAGLGLRTEELNVVHEGSALTRVRAWLRRLLNYNDLNQVKSCCHRMHQAHPRLSS